MTSTALPVTYAMRVPLLGSERADRLGLVVNPSTPVPWFPCNAWLASTPDVARRIAVDELLAGNVGDATAYAIAARDIEQAYWALLHALADR